MLSQHLFVLSLSLATATACVEHSSVLERGTIGFPRPEIFWPPPPATSVWTSPLSSPVTFGEAVTGIARTLDGAGYSDKRLYPIGVDYAHGFAIATKLERITDDAHSAGARWLSLYPRATNLRWLEQDRSPELPGAGRYRAFLIAFTDLPTGETKVAPRWTEETWMDGLDAPIMELRAERRASERYRVAVYVYEYAAPGMGGEGRFIEQDLERTGEAHVKASGLSGLGGL